MTDVPDKVWVWIQSIDDFASSVLRKIDDEDKEDSRIVRFVRADPDILASLPEVQALIADAVSKATSA